MRTDTGLAIDWPRHGENIAALFERILGGDQRAAARPRFDDNNGPCEAANQPITYGKQLWQWSGSKRECDHIVTMPLNAGCDGALC